MKRADIPKYINEEYWELWDLYRWYKSGIIELNMGSYPLNVLRGVRLLNELNRG